MKCFALIILMTLSAKTFAQKQYLVKGNTPESLNNKKVFLLVQDTYSLNTFFLKYSTIIKNKSFQFSGDMKHPSQTARIYTLNKNGTVRDNFNFYLDSGVNTININAVDSSNPYQNNRFSTASISYPTSRLTYKTIDSIYQEAFKRYGVPDKLSPQITIIPQERQRDIDYSILSMISKYPDDFHSLIELYKIGLRGMDDSLDYVMKSYLELSPTIMSTSLGKEFYEVVTTKAKAYKITKAGNEAPLFSIKNDKTGLFNNADLLGKPYIIAFSATWCIPCQLYQKTLLNLYHKYQSKGLEVVYFNLDDNETKWKKHISDKKLDWINVSERTKFKDSKIAKTFNAYSIPFDLVIDKAGKIIYNSYQLSDDNHSKLEEYIKKAIND